MRLLLMVCLAFCGLVGLASAQESANPAVVESVISAVPEADGKEAYLLSVMLKDGRQLSLRVGAADAREDRRRLEQDCWTGLPEGTDSWHACRR
jgi:hypothetical protein